MANLAGQRPRLSRKRWYQCSNRGNNNVQQRNKTTNNPAGIDASASIGGNSFANNRGVV
jgi:hypothetical protein